MAVAMMFDNPNASADQYDAVRERIGVSEDNPPEGAILHIAGPSPNGGWRVIEVWETEEAARKFASETLEPVFREVGIQRPAPQVWQVHNLMKR